MLTLQIRVLASELSAKVIAATPASSKAFTPLVNFLISSVFGGSSSAIMVTFRSTLSTIVSDCLTALISSASSTIGVTNLRETGFKPFTARLTALIWSGVVPQHPPIRRAPSATSSSALFPK